MGLDGDKQDQVKPESLGADSLPQDRRNALDYNNEIAGRETGRAKRFLASDTEATRREKERANERAFNALMRALQDPEYAKLYDQAQQTVEHAQDATNKALQRLTRESGIASEELSGIRDSAAELPDGRKVYRSATDGRLYAEDGTDVSDQADKVVGLTAQSSSWEDYKRSRDALDDIERRRREVENYQRDVLDPANDRLQDEDSPPSQEELTEIIENTEAAMPADVRQDYEPPNFSEPALSKPAKGSAASEYVGAAKMGAPELLLDFAAAHDGPDAEAPSATPAPIITPRSP